MVKLQHTRQQRTSRTPTGQLPDCLPCPICGTAHACYTEQAYANAKLMAEMIMAVCNTARQAVGDTKGKTKGISTQASDGLISPVMVAFIGREVLCLTASAGKRWVRAS